MYSIIRLVISCVFLGASTTIVKKTRVIRKHLLYVVFTSISLVLLVVLAFLPFENLFVTFSSPEAAYAYYSFNKPNIELAIEGNNCDFIVDRENETETYLIIPKTVDGWKIGIGANTKIKAQRLSDGIVVYVYQYKNTNDYFVTIFDTNGGESTVSDEYNTEFYSLVRYSDSIGKTFVTYYAHIANFDSQYSVVVNGSRIVLGQGDGLREP